MAIEKIYTITNVKDNKDGYKVFISLLFIALVAIVGLGVWFIYKKKQSEKSLSNAESTVDSTKAKSLEKPSPREAENPKHTGVNKDKSTFLKDLPKPKVNDNAIEDKGAGTTNIIVGRVIKQQPNQTETGEPGVMVSFFHNNAKKEVVTDANGNYEINLPVIAENGIDCKIVLYYKKGSLLNTQQIISCNQKNITDIKF